MISPVPVAAVDAGGGSSGDLLAQPLRNRSPSAAFLCYHSVSDAGPPFLSLGPDLFERQLATLRREGWASGTEADLPNLAAGRRPDRPLVFLTFDDGFRDNYTHALPLLEAYGFGAHVFLLPPLVDTGAALAWPEVEERRRQYPEAMRSVTWTMVQRMAERGLEFGSHTCSHPHLPQLGDEQLHQELSDSRRRIIERLGRCQTIAYPFGEWSPRVHAAAAATGYSYGYALPYGSPLVRGQAEATPLSIPRLVIDHRDVPLLFSLKLRPRTRSVLLSDAKGHLRGVMRRMRR